jgi:hypothetical protein
MDMVVSMAPKKKLGGVNMKRILVLAVIAVFVMMPLASFAKTAISDSDLSAVTAQEGVTINFDNFLISNIQIDVQGWGDNDGFSGYTSAGWVGAKITTTHPSGVNLINLSGDLTIDVGTNGAVTAVKLGLPGISIGGSITQELSLAPTSAGLATGGPGRQIIGTMVMSGITLSTSGYVVVTAHAAP